MKHILSLSALAVALPVTLAAQAQPPAAPVAPPKAPAAATTRPAPRPTSATFALAVQVTDKSGNGIGDVAVTLTGPVERSGRTVADGSVTFRTVRTGTYRLRFEHERYITLEREVMAGSRAADVSVALNPAPTVKPVAAPPPPAPAPVSTPVQQHRAVEPRTLSILDFLDKNLIGSQPQKTSLLACTDGGTARILQVKDPITNQVNADADQILYVLGGNGIVRIRDQEHKATAGWFALIPRGVPLGVRRDGRTPVVTLTAAMGAPCADTSPLAR